MLRLLHRVLQLGAGLQQQVGLVSKINKKIRSNVDDNISKRKSLRIFFFINISMWAWVFSSRLVWFLEMARSWKCTMKVVCLAPSGGKIVKICENKYFVWFLEIARSWKCTMKIGDKRPYTTSRVQLASDDVDGPGYLFLSSSLANSDLQLVVSL